MQIFASPFGDIALRDVSITERVFEGMTDPDAVVMIDGSTGRQFTAGELVSGVKSLAGGLTERGLGKGHCIALMAPNIPEFFVVFHAAAWAGATITTVNPTYTAHELNHQLRDAGAELLITVPAFLDTALAGIEGTAVTEVCVIGEAPGATPISALMRAPLEAQAPVNAAEDIVVLPYSSGTTGLPKGVMLTHRNLVANVDQCQAARPIEDGEWTVGFLPFFHIYGMTVLLNLYLGNGGRVVTMPRFDFEQFLRLCETHRTKQAFCVPPVVLAIAKHPLVDQFDLKALRYVFSGAAPLGAPLSEAVVERLGVACEQGYGMTEMSPVSHISAHGKGRHGSAGKTLTGTECRIVDPETGKDMDVGQEGELWIRGPQVMRGYLNNPEATAKTLTPDGWLKTGDLATYDNDDYVFVRERLKELIKVKGFQVAPAELEAEILSHPSIADVAVIGIPDEEAGEVPMAFLVAAPGTSPTAEEVTAHLQDRLAHYKQVRAFRFVDAIPKSASGKILRRVLRDKVGN